MPTNSDPGLILNKITIPQGITPINKASQYPTHYSDWAFGGLRSVNISIAVTSVTERDAIPVAQRYVGLTVIDTGPVVKTYYRLVAGIENSNWVAYNTQSDDFIGTTKNEIPDLRRIEGMLVYIIDEDSYYRLESGITNLNWVEFSSGGGGVGLKEEPFTVSSWVDTPTIDPTMLTATITHSLDTTNIDVEWYETGREGTVTVPWKVDPLDTKNKIIGCIPLGMGNAFPGLVRITSSVSTGGGGMGSPDFVLTFEPASWTEFVPSTDDLFIDVNHGLDTPTPATEIYNDPGNEQLLDIEIRNNLTVRLIVNRVDVFAGYVHVRG